MRYAFVRWIHSFPDEPILLLSEIDDQGYERRKIDVFSDGSFVSATQAFSNEATYLSSERFPELSEINLSEEFDAVAGTAEVFELFWRLAVA